jgi:hypothetical protein
MLVIVDAYITDCLKSVTKKMTVTSWMKSIEHSWNCENYYNVKDVSPGTIAKSPTVLLLKCVQ